MRVIHKQSRKHTYLKHKHFRIKLTLGTYILFGLFSGAIAGYFLGQRAAFLSQIGTVLIDLIMMWILFFILAVAFYSIFPSIDQHSLYTFSSGAKQSLAEQFIPTNPFNALANSYVPAVVVFFTCLGIAIISVKEKTSFLGTMKTLLYGLLKLNSFMVNLVPVIVFAFTAAMVFCR